MQQRFLGEFQVSAIGLGCMNFSHAYGAPPPTADAEGLFMRALDLGVTHFDTASLYGFGVNETLVGKIMSPHRSRFTLASKCAMYGAPGEDGVLRRVIDGRPETLKHNCEASLKRLRTDVIDLYYLHRWDKQVPIEDSVGALAELVQEGKIRSIGLSEVSADTLRRAHAVHPIAALQTEYSLWTRNPEIAVLQACRDLKVSFVAFSPVGRGFLAGAIASADDVARFSPQDVRQGMPRFHGDALQANLRLLEDYRALAREAGCSPAQLSLAWLLHQGEDILPIPGTTSIAHLEDNVGAAGVTLSEDILRRAGAIFNQQTTVGNRYSEQARQEVDTEEF